MVLKSLSVLFLLSFVYCLLPIDSFLSQASRLAVLGVIVCCILAHQLAKMLNKMVRAHKQATEDKTQQALHAKFKGERQLALQAKQRQLERQGKEGTGCGA